MLQCWSSGQWDSPSSFTKNFLLGSHLNRSPSEILYLMDCDKAQTWQQLTLLLPPWSHHKFIVLKLYYFVINWGGRSVSLGYIRMSCFASSSWVISVSSTYAENPQAERTIYPSVLRGTSLLQASPSLFCHLSGNMSNKYRRWLDSCHMLIKLRFPIQKSTLPAFSVK